MTRAAALGLAVLVCAGAAVASAQAPRAEPMRPPVPAGSDPADWEAHFDRGVKLFREAPAEAAAHFYWASRLDPSRAEPYFARWSSYLFRAKNEDVYAYIRGDEALWRREDFLAADALRQRAMMRNPFVHRGLEVLVYDRLPGEFSESRDTRAWIAYTEAKFPQAVALFTRTIDRGGPKAIWSRYDRSLASVAAGDMVSALADLRMLLEELRKRDEQALVGFYASKHQLLHMIGLLHNQMGDRAAAKTAFGEATVENAAFAYAWAGLAALSTASRQHAQAVSEYEQAVQLETGDGYLHFLHGTALFNAQRYEGAYAALQQAVALEPHFAAPHYLLGRVRERQGREPEAYPHYQKYVALASQKDPQAKAMRYRLELRARSDSSKPATR